MFHDCFSGGVQVEGSVEWCEISHFARCLLHQVLPVFSGDLSVSHPKQDFTKKHLPGILT